MPFYLFLLLRNNQFLKLFLHATFILPYNKTVQKWKFCTQSWRINFTKCKSTIYLHIGCNINHEINRGDFVLIMECRLTNCRKLHKIDKKSECWKQERLIAKWIEVLTGDMPIFFKQTCRMVKFKSERSKLSILKLFWPML